jgi:hypothetical protein
MAATTRPVAWKRCARCRAQIVEAGKEPAVDDDNNPVLENSKLLYQ